MQINDEIEIVVPELKGNQVRIGIEALVDVIVLRPELNGTEVDAA